MVDNKTKKPVSKTKKDAAPKKSETATPADLAKKGKVEVKTKQASPAVVKTKPIKESLPKNGPMITIKQFASPIRRDGRQVLYLKSLGLGKMNRERQIIDNPSTRGLLEKVKHMVRVVE